MKKQLLLMSLLINLFIFSSNQKNINNSALQLVNNLNNFISSQRLPAHSLASDTAGDLSAPVKASDQLEGQISEVTPTPTLTPLPDKKNAAPTRTPRPTTTPVPIPPPANPNATSLMILFGLIAVIVVIVGVWLNRSENNNILK